MIVLCLRAQAACAEEDWAAAEESLELALRTARGGAGFPRTPWWRSEGPRSRLARGEVAMALPRPP